ncbi:hypothetical protein BIWAKO_01186 [Bosea sp. BIWAKO-01]|nr:hypothetical protein BIWAKO_01186 [Bosea sp. BIWAKO-01]
MTGKRSGPKRGMRISGKADASTDGQIIRPDTISGLMIRADW